MNREYLPRVNPGLKEIQNQFETWRQTRQKRTPIPDALWQAAVSLAKNHSILEISKALRLNYTDLKHRVLAQNNEGDFQTNQNHTFIELDLQQPVSPPRCVIEMEKSNGAKMKMHFTGNTHLDFLELGKSFWSNGS